MECRHPISMTKKRKAKVELKEERFLATIAYDGTDYLGWQIQPRV